MACLVLARINASELFKCQAVRVPLIEGAQKKETIDPNTYLLIQFLSPISQMINTSIKLFIHEIV